ncbi:MAG: hypothetical protein NCW75_13765 [Phycisphaera sp.]|nr:MAG: hypothetical protein NCW75_13765 [Phycisphaera sp.]
MLDHAALLVRSIEGMLARLGQVDADCGPIEEFPGEGTRELYLGPPGRPGRLLLIEPLGEDGPYARALWKRGPGLHHAAFATASIDAFLSDNPGWLLHPISLKTRDTSARTINRATGLRSGSRHADPVGSVRGVHRD